MVSSFGPQIKGVLVSLLRGTRKNSTVIPIVTKN